MTACSTFSSARNVRSTTAPVRVLQLRAHERAALARLHVLELDDGHEALGEVQGHAVLQVVGGDAHRHEILREFGEGDGPVSGDDDGVFDADAADARQVHAGLDGHHVAGSEGTSRTSRRPAGPRGSRAPRRARCRAANASPQPASSMTSRHARSTAAHSTPDRDRVAGPPAARAAPCPRRRRASGPGSPTLTVRVMSEQYPSTMQPKSMTTSSPRRDRPVGRAGVRLGAVRARRRRSGRSSRRSRRARASPNSSSSAKSRSVGRVARAAGSSVAERVVGDRARGADAGDLAGVLHHAGGPRPGRSVGDQLRAGEPLRERALLRPADAVRPRARARATPAAASPGSRAGAPGSARCATRASTPGAASCSADWSLVAAVGDEQRRRSRSRAASPAEPVNPVR